MRIFTRDRTGQVWHGFTLIELLVVISIIGVLIALLLPAVQAAREAARRTACANQIRQHTVALQNFHGEKNRFPEGATLHELPNQTGLSWRVFILPFLEEQPLYDRIGPTPNGGATNFIQPQSEMPDLLRCPSTEPAVVSNSTLQMSSYWGVAGARRPGRGLSLSKFLCGDLHQNGVLYPGSRTRISMIEDGTSHTLAIGERTYTFSAWMTGSTWRGTSAKFTEICSEASNHATYPINADLSVHGYYYGHPGVLPVGGIRKMLTNDLPFGSLHPGGAHFGRADGSVSFIDDEIDITIFENISTINGGEVEITD